MNHATKRFISLLGGLVIVLIAAFVYISLTMPLFTEIEDRRGELNAKISANEIQEKNINQIRKILESYQGSREVMDALSITLPDGPKAEEMLAQIQGLSLSTHVGLTSLNFSSPQGISGSGNSATRPLGSAVSSIKASGSYEDIRAFLQGLEQNIRIINIKDINITPDGATSLSNPSYTTPSSTKINIDARLEYYYQRIDPAASKVIKTSNQ
jgi:Tfp pilus assembly protein PilO